jgi:hypothetical protein
VKFPLAPVGPPGTSTRALSELPNRSSCKLFGGAPGFVLAAIVACRAPAPLDTTVTPTLGLGLHCVRTGVLVGVEVDVGVEVGVGVKVGVEVSVGVRVSVGVGLGGTP